MKPNIAIRLGTEGGAEVRRDIDSIGSANEAAANRARTAWNRASDDVEAAQRRQAAAAAKIAAIAPQSAMQMRINDNVGSGSTLNEGSARVSAAAFRELIAEQERYAASAEKIRLALDPAYAAQTRYNTEISQARTLVSAGALSLDEYVGKLRLEQQILEGTAQAHGRVSASTGAVKAGTQQLTYQLNDMVTMWSMQAPPMQIFTSQAGQVIGAIQLMAGESKGFIGWLGGPWGMGITTAGIVLAVLAGNYLSNEEAAKRAEKAAKDFGDRQSDIANFIDTTTGALKEQNKTLVLNAILTRQAQIAANEQDISEGRRKAFDRAAKASLRGVRAAPGSTTSGVSFEDDADVQAAIRNANGNVDVLSRNLASLSRRRPELRGVALDVSSIGGQAIIATRENERLGKELRALGGDTSALAKADTSLIEARAKLAGATTASDRAQAQYTISVREARAAYDASNKTTADQVKLQTALTAAEHDLNKAQDDGKASRAALTAERRAHAKAVREAAKEERELQNSLVSLEKIYDPAAASAREYREELEKIAALLSDKRIDKDQAESWTMQARARRFLPNLKDQLQPDIDKEKEQAERDTRRSQYVTDTKRDLRDENIYLAAELGLIRASNDSREMAIIKLRAIAELSRERVSLESADGAAILASVEAAEAKRQLLQHLKDDWAELTNFGRDFVDTVLSPDTWSSWSNAGKTVINMLQQEMLKLAVANPIKNFLFGDGLATIGSIGKLFGGAGAGTDIVMGGAYSNIMRGNAVGTEYWTGGMTYVGENGRELVDLPRGSKVYTANDTRRMSQAGQQQVVFEVRGLKGDVFDVAVAQISSGQIAQTAPSIADSSSRGTQVAMRRRASRSLV